MDATEHSETSWGMRSHLLMQFLNGAVARAYCVNRSVLGELPFGNEPASPDHAWSRGPASESVKIECRRPTCEDA